ncbi:MAG: CaiB/BaiF CoA transferase family protein [Dehalococcoidia bacterium]
MIYSLLEGLRVLELGGFISAPYCGKLLADMGAQVTKIEPLGTGDPSRQYGPFLNDDPHRERSGLFLYLNANKRGLTVNLDTPTGRDILRNLVAHSDALVHNFSVQQMEQLGVDYEALSQANPALVMASITPFGLNGPYRDYRAYDINLAAAGGICEGLGVADRAPLTFGTPEVGYFAGMAAASAIVMAILALNPNPPSSRRGEANDRSQGLRGQHIDIAEVETMAGLYNGSEGLMAMYQWRLTRRTGHHALDFPYPNCVLRCKDGYIFVGSPEGRQWRQLLEVMGNPEWSKDPRFRSRTEMNNRYADELDGYLEAWLMDYTKEELLALALEHRIPLAPVRNYAEVCHDPSLADLFVDIERADTGTVSYPGPPYLLAEAKTAPPTPAPYLGQHNEEVYCGTLDYTREQLVKLYQTGII